MPDSRVVDFYRRFAVREASGQSRIYEAWASGVAEDPDVVALIAALPGMKQQPNLVFAAARFLGAPEGTYEAFRSWLLGHWDRVEPMVLSRATQTNEAGRCAVLLPVLSRLDGPLALIEVGAAAGLCLYPDRYSYRYGFDGQTATLDPEDGPSAVTIPCEIDAESVPRRLPEVVWRAGLDLNPIAPDDLESRAWLRTLVWPEHEDRRRRLEAALAIAAAEPPHLVAGDLVDSIADLIAAAPRGVPVVVFHSAVLVYVEQARRERFADFMRSLEDVTWISNEGERVLPRVAERLPGPAGGRMVLAVNETPIAFVGPHGQSYEALTR
ncbi:DUF2332 domain-containing protein [Curtobacterium sp. ISL-83]|uniref:DUF2332 domain-containing protein n=1 Tax=Curtobacterium sp. ISL-83 TaxID=2819145 RepID=UPI001BEBA3E2|nr:DUF2332 domain-containing protein [Curtobacterium sp. ISL-83]MBT2503875.1 DUF2332 domain-containing protein [Curtobacterium sp. ISL-83]